MKTLACLVLASCALAGPGVSFAQSNAPVFRAQMRAEPIRLEQGGYRVADVSHGNYPEQIPAEAKIAAQDSQQAGNSYFGAGASSGTSAYGSAQPVSDPSPSSCVGPASYCNIFFGN
ncbi:purine nucleoside phosphorylase [Caballeronia arvi]|uniref:Purine nucleoside phosphorylase n=1 Tax=Caballeronia arvi TaxID=1777135 RepID=A0A158L2U4_9BURK|nr:DUF4148 domain-containing protein [Caballeronia arvi]SAL87718.1 purine nucleoside phosphorylase [Caballeronia arvi]